MKLRARTRVSRTKSLIILALLGLSSVFVIVEIPGVHALAEFIAAVSF